MEEVVSGKRIAGRLEKLCVQRSIQLWDHPDYFFDEDEVNRVLNIVSLFRHTAGDYYGEPWTFLDWQPYFFAHIFGLKYRETNKRVTRKVLLCMSKKGGKSELAGAVGNIFTFFDGEKTPACYSVANKLDQAMYCFDAARRIAKQLASESESFRNDLEIHNSHNNRKIFSRSTEAFFKPIAADAKTLDGVNPHLAVIDEYHEAKDSAIPKNMISGMVQRSQPLLLYVTTRGFHINGPLANLEKAYIDILEGKLHDDSVFPLIFSLDQEDLDDLQANWGKPFEKHNWKNWKKAIPGLGQAPSIQGIKNVYNEAITEGVSAEVSFKTKNLNIWVRQSRSWITDNIWMQGNKKINLEDLHGRQCFGAYDLSSKYDLTALGLLFPPNKPDQDFIFLCRFYCPRAGAELRAKKDRVPYLDWAKENVLTLTPGNVLDLDYVRDDIRKQMELYDVVNYQYDPMFARDFSTELYNEGVEVHEFRQTVTNYNEPIERLEKIIATGKLNHQGDPVLRWMAGNVVLYINSTGLKRFDKKKSAEKIDGMVALAMCVGGWLDWKAENETINDLSKILGWVKK